MDVRDRMYGCFLGAVVGDAFGSAYEFKQRDTYKVSPNMEMTVFGLPAGSFTDDSSMLLCLAESLIVKKGFDPVDQMERYVKWWTDGYMSSSPERGCFDIGRTTRVALGRFLSDKKQNKPIDGQYGLDGEFDSGNGGIMRLAPIPILYWIDVDIAGSCSALSSKTTHASTECLECATLMGRAVALLLQGRQKSDVLDDLKKSEPIVTSTKIQDICSGSYLQKSRDDISTSGYVVHTLEAALWAFFKTSTFEQGMLLLAGMGGDVDTVCCVYGQLAGAFYGLSAVPTRWKQSLQRLDLLCDICARLVALAIKDGHR